MAESSIERVRFARGRVAAVADRLLRPSPDAWDAYGSELEDAARLMAEVESELQHTGVDRSSRDVLRAEVAGLQRDVGRVGRLMGAAAQCYLGWSHLLGAALSGYGCQGTVIPLQPPARLSIQG